MSIKLLTNLGLNQLILAKPILMNDNRSMIPKVSLIGGMLALCMSFNSLATPVKNKSIWSNWYVGSAKSGRSASDYNQDLAPAGAEVAGVPVEDKRVGWKLNLGYDVTDNIAIEAGYLDLNDVAIETAAQINDGSSLDQNNSVIYPSSADGFTISSIYRYNISQRFGLKGSIGVFNWDGDFSSKSLVNNPTVSTDNDSGTDFYFGLGGGYQLTDEMTLSVEWERYQLNSEETDVWSIGVDYHF